MSNWDLGRMTELFHHRWNVPVLAALAAGGSRFVVLQNSVGASRDALRASLDTLAAAGLVEANPGYGHPLRPEYLLTESGAALAPACVGYRDTAEVLDVADIAYRKWTAPVLLALADGASGFNAIQHGLGAITPRALTQALKALDGSDLLIRTVDDGYPPRTLYALTASGTRLAGGAGKIATLLSSPTKVDPP